jgi:Cu(I)/Ag(I) efflux system membrane fusion protein
MAATQPQPQPQPRSQSHGALRGESVDRMADALRNMGVSNAQLREMGKQRELVPDIRVESPVDGVVLQRSVSPGLRFDRGFEFYRIADLTRVWILADVYRNQLPFIRRGASARITTAGESRVVSATVSPSEPIFDESTLTLKVRLEASNPQRALKPGMFVDVEFPVDHPATLVVPADAIVDSGLRKTVFVDRGNGSFEPRLVETGWRAGDDVEVTKGLVAGERIVISGTFFVDSESRMKAATRGASAAPMVDPVCGMHVDPREARNAGRTAEHGEHVFFFCSDNCKQQFLADPSRHAKPTVVKP